MRFYKNLKSGFAYYFYSFDPGCIGFLDHCAVAVVMSYFRIAAIFLISPGYQGDPLDIVFMYRLKICNAHSPEEMGSLLFRIRSEWYFFRINEHLLDSHILVVLEVEGLVDQAISSLALIETAIPMLSSFL